MIRTGSVVVAFLLGASVAARAHRANLFAAPEGATIRGYAYLSGGGRLRGAQVTVHDPGGQQLAALQTDEKGEFSFNPISRVDHTFRLALDAGHHAAWTVPAAELPPDLPAPVGTGATSMRPAAAGVDAYAEARRVGVDPEQQPGTGPPASPSHLVTVVRRELAPLQAQIQALRREQAERADQRRLRDILGGIGYLVGIGGLWAYSAARRRGRRR